MQKRNWGSIYTCSWLVVQPLAHVLSALISHVVLISLVVKLSLARDVSPGRDVSSGTLRPHFFWVARKSSTPKVGAGHQNCPFFRIDLLSSQTLNFLYIYALFSYLPFYTAELLKVQIALSCMRSRCGSVVPVILKRAVLLSSTHFSGCELASDPKKVGAWHE